MSRLGEKKKMAQGQASTMTQQDPQATRNVITSRQYTLGLH